MTAPIQPQRDVVAEMRAALAQARAAGASKEQMDFLLRAWTREVQNVNEAEQAAHPIPRSTSERVRGADNTLDRILPALGLGQEELGGLASFAKDVPGGEAMQAGARSFVRGQPYTEALGDIRGAEAEAPTAVRRLNRIAGGGIAAAALPIKSPALAGASFGGASNLLDADPTSVGTRALNTGIGTVVGGTLGKVVDMGITGLRGVLAEPIGNALTRLKNARAAASGPRYAEALAQGVGQTSTPEIQSWLARPEVQDIVSHLQGLDEFAGLAPDDPKMLDAIYKALSDQTGTIVRRMNTAAPSQPNVGQAMERQLRTVRQQGLSAMSDAPNAPMPAMREGVEAFAEGSRRIEGFKRGQRAMAIETGAGSSPENLERFGRDNLLDWLKRQSPEVREATVQGMTGLGQRKLAQGGVTGLVNPMRGMSRNYLTRGGDLLRAVEGTASTNANAPLSGGTLLDYLQRLGITEATPTGIFP